MIRLKNLKLIGLLSLLVSFNSFTLDSNKQIEISKMLGEFLNPSCEPTKSFERWIDELQLLIEKEPEFKRFLPVLAKVRNQKNVNVIKLTIVQNRTIAPKFVQDMLGTDLTKLSSILSARLSVRSK